MEKKLSESTARKIQELQAIEQTFQNILLQRQAFSLELNETTEALEEVKSAKDGIYKILGQIIIKAKKDDLEKDLRNKKELFELRMRNLEKQEQVIREKLMKLRTEVMKELQ